MALYTIPPRQQVLACEECGCVVDGSERGRGLHTRWHECAQVVDLTEVERVREDV